MRGVNAFVPNPGSAESAVLSIMPNPDAPVPSGLVKSEPEGEPKREERMPKANGGYDETLDGDFAHNDDIITVGEALDGVRLVVVDRNAVYNRNIGYIRESIEASKKRRN